MFELKAADKGFGHRNDSYERIALPVKRVRHASALPASQPGPALTASAGARQTTLSAAA